MMNKLLKFEDAAEWIFSIFLFSKLTFAWWWYPALILVPDLSMIGYVVNTKVGAVLYNLVHHKAVGITIGIIGFLISNEALILTGLILFSHSCMDRVFGYGLKFSDSFQHTHLGSIGK